MSHDLTFGERVQALRKQRGWTQTQLAEKIGCDKGTICHWEHGETIPKISRACDLARVLHTTVEALSGRAEYCRSQEIADLKRENLRLKKALMKVRMDNLNICDEIREVLIPDPLMKGEDE